MCGIVGVCGELIGRRKFEGAVDLLAHRGPDGRGGYQDDQVLLGHRRLSIIDLSEGGRQPMKDPDGDAVLVFNGEIYNYLELRGQLKKLGCKFRTRSDSEVLLKAFVYWGTAALTKLNGMWAFAIWRPREKKLHFARDRFGVKPFYYLVDGTRFAFASEPKALTALYPEYRVVDRCALYRFLAEGNLYGDGRSFYEGIRVLPAAHCGTYDVTTGRLSISRFWDYPREISEVRDPVDAVEEFGALFEDAVRLRLRSDVSVGLTLSGGLDSTSILAATHAVGRDSLRCFTSSYEDREVGEAAWAELAAKQRGNPLESVEATREHWLETMPAIAWHMDGPGYSPAVYPLWELMRVAREADVPVMLEGQGADELFGGYIAHGVANMTGLMLRALRSARWTHWRAVFSAWGGMTLSHPRNMILKRIGVELFPGVLPYYRAWRGSLGVLRPAFAQQSSKSSGEKKIGRLVSGGDRAARRLLVDHQYAVLPGLLHYGDAISMAHGIESRQPYLDYRLVEWGFRQPASIKFCGGETKWPERAYLRRTGWHRFGNRWDKRGYPTPVGAWMRENGAAAPKKLLTSRDARILEFCDPRRVGHLIDSYLAGARGSENHIYRLISTEFWLQSCF